MSALPAGPTRRGGPSSTRPGVKPGEFLGHYAERLPSVELNSTGYRIPAEDQFRRWAEQTPSGFRFAVKMQAYQLRQAATFEERVSSARRAARPDPPARHPGARRRVPHARARLARRRSSDRVRLSARVVEGHRAPRERGPRERARRPAPFRYLRFREPPYSDEDLAIRRERSVRCSRLGSRSTRTSGTRTSRLRPRTRSGYSSFWPRAEGWVLAGPGRGGQRRAPAEDPCDRRDGELDLLVGREEVLAEAETCVGPEVAEDARVLSSSA